MSESFITKQTVKNSLYLCELIIFQGAASPYWLRMHWHTEKFLNISWNQSSSTRLHKEYSYYAIHRHIIKSSKANGAANIWIPHVQTLHSAITAQENFQFMHVNDGCVQLSKSWATMVWLWNSQLYNGPAMEPQSNSWTSGFCAFLNATPGGQ